MNESFGCFVVLGLTLATIKLTDKKSFDVLMFLF